MARTYYILPLLVLFLFPSVTIADSCNYTWGVTPVQQSIASCWAASASYLAHLFNWGSVGQGDLNFYACSKGKATACYYANSHVIWDGGCEACQIYEVKCGLTPAETADIMNSAGYYGASLLSGGYTPTELVAKLCTEQDKIYALYSMDYSTVGHAAVAVGYDEMGDGFSDDLVTWMDPNYSNYRVSLYSAFCYPIEYGTLQWNMAIYGFSPSIDFLNITSVNDIQSFHAQNSSGTIELAFEISAGANPNQEAAVYISDNPLGPGRLVPGLVGPAEPMPGINHWYHTPVSGSSYYYFLDYDYGFADNRKVGELRSATENPIYHSSGRPVYDPPGNVTAADVTVDRGRRLDVTWELSQDEASIDCYHIFRKEYPEQIGGQYEYLATATKGISMYVDTSVAIDDYYSYRVSSAHHGTYSGALTYQYGLYNDFSAASAAIKPTDELYQVIVSFPSDDYANIVTCPEGDGDTLRARVTITDSNDMPTQGISAFSIKFLIFSGVAIHTCSDQYEFYALHETDEAGRAEFEYPYLSSCDSLSIMATVYDRTSGNIVKANTKTYDLNLDGSVNLSDFTLFGPSYNKNCGDPYYCPCADCNFDCRVDLSDLVRFGDHYSECNCQ